MGGGWFFWLAGLAWPMRQERIVTSFAWSRVCQKAGHLELFVDWGGLGWGGRFWPLGWPSVLPRPRGKQHRSRQVRLSSA